MHQEKNIIELFLHKKNVNKKTTKIEDESKNLNLKSKEIKVEFSSKKSSAINLLCFSIIV